MRSFSLAGAGAGERLRGDFGVRGLNAAQWAAMALVIAG